VPWSEKQQCCKLDYFCKTEIETRTPLSERPRRRRVERKLGRRLVGRRHWPVRGRPVRNTDGTDGQTDGLTDRLKDKHDTIGLRVAAVNVASTTKQRTMQNEMTYRSTNICPQYPTHAFRRTRQDCRVRVASASAV